MGTRVFTAINISDEELLKKLIKIRNRLNLGFNPVKKEKMHITFEFFQDIDESDLKILKNHLQSIEHTEFSINVKNIGCFPSNSHIRVVWAGIESQELFELYDKISSHNLEADNNYYFEPHITLFRLPDNSQNQKRKLKKQIEEHKDWKFGKMRVENFKLYKSIPKNGKMIYKELESYNLKREE